MMKKSAFNMLWAGCVVACGGFGAAHADAYEQANYGYSDHNHGPGHYYAEGCGDYAFDPCCNKNFDISVDYLYWQVCQSDDLPIGESDTNRGVFNGLTLTNAITDSETKVFDFNYKSGFRVALGYRLPCSDLELGVVYTNYHFHHHNTITPGLAGGIWASNFPPFSPFVSNGLANEAHASVKLQYDLIDVLISSKHSCGNYTGRAYGGVRVLLFEEDYEVTYDGLVLGGTGSGGRTKWHVNMPAGGLTGGYEARYHVDCGFGLLGRLGVSFLGGDPKAHQHWETFRTSGTGPYNGQQHAKHGQFLWGWDAALGFTYDIPCDCYPVVLAVGYEITDWWDMPRMRQFVSDTFPGVSTSDEGGRFTAHGLFVRLGTTF